MRTQGATEAAQTGDLLATETGRVEFLPPDPAQQAEIVDALIRVVGGLYAHLPLKRAMYGIDPVQQLRRLEQRLASLQPGGFHRELGDVIRSLRDAHTVYVGPKALAGRVARLPFLIEVFEESGEPRYMVSKVAEGLVSDPDFKPGVELEWWNGAPFVHSATNQHPTNSGWWSATEPSATTVLGQAGRFGSRGPSSPLRRDRSRSHR
jgi:hypothetical protein